MSVNLQQELSDLIQKGFLDPSITINDLRSDLHYTKLWADSFWRRKLKHTNREDPEVIHVLKLNPTSLLEIGIAYGRVATKIHSSMGFKLKYTGIEVCPYFKDYIPIFIKDHPELSNVEFIYDNLFKTNLLENRKFDVILLPMNTLPGFPPITVELLLRKIKDLLDEGGKFIFSNYKIPEIIDEGVIQKYTNENGSEILEDEEDIIELFFTQLYLKATDIGMYSRSYHKYIRRDKTNRILESGVFQNQTTFWKQSSLTEKIESEGFKIDHIDDSSHSLVYILSKA